MATQVLPGRPVQAHRNLVILGVSVLTLLLFGPTLKTIVSLGIHDDRYLQIVVAPLACVSLLFLNRREIFPRSAYSPQAGIPWLAASGLFGALCAYMGRAGNGAGLVVAVLGMISLWMAAFLLCCGPASFRSGIYPLSCLFLMIPFPASWMDRVAVFLQHGSASTAYQILHLTGIPTFRHGMVFSLPGLDFEVGAECSGIHSGLALMIIAVLAGYLCLQCAWTRSVLIILTVPIAVFKNAIRIVVIAALGSRVDRAFIDGPFHHRYGGAIFSVVGVVPFVLLLAGLQRVERWRRLRKSV